jgi:hypothetical protein
MIVIIWQHSQGSTTLLELHKCNHDQITAAAQCHARQFASTSSWKPSLAPKNTQESYGHTRTLTGAPAAHIKLLLLLLHIGDPTVPTTSLLQHVLLQLDLKLYCHGVLELLQQHLLHIQGLWLVLLLLKDVLLLEVQLLLKLLLLL